VFVIYTSIIKKMKKISFYIFLFSIYLANCEEIAESEALTCDEFEVAGASDASFNGEYEVSPLNVTGASQNEAVYEKKNGGGKFIFWKNAGWALGSNKTTGVVDYRGQLPTAKGTNTTWQGIGGQRDSTITIINRSAVCSEDFDTDEDDEYLGDLISMSDGRNGCRGALAIFHMPQRQSRSIGTHTRTFKPTNYRNTWRLFRRRSVARVEVWGTCSWRLYHGKFFRGGYLPLRPGSNNHVNFGPKSIAQLE